MSAMSRNKMASDNTMKSGCCCKLVVLEQPTEMFRFRYKSEMQGTHGSLNGERSKRHKKSFPEVELKNFYNPAVIRCSLYQINNPFLHSHRLMVQKEDIDVCDPHHVYVSPEKGYIARFENTGIIHTAKKDICNELLKKKKVQLRLELGREELSKAQEEILQVEAEQEAKDMDLNKVRLCFEAFQIINGGRWKRICEPVFSRPINNRKSALTGELKICSLSHVVGSAAGGDDLIILVEKVNKNQIKVRFYEEVNGEEVWEAFGYFTEANVHHQYAILLRTPAYKNTYIDRDVNVFIELVRDSDNERSSPVQFRYKPQRATSKPSSSTQISNPVNYNDMEPVTNPNESGFMQHVSDNIDEVSNMFQDSFERVFEMLEFQKDGEEQCYIKLQEYHPTLKLLTSVFNDCPKVGLEKSIKRVLTIFEDYIANNDNRDSIVHEIVKQGSQSDAQIILKILSKLNLTHLLSRTNSLLHTPLHVACVFDRAIYISPLLGLKCDPNVQDAHGNTALHIAIAESLNTCTERLISHISSNDFNMNLRNNDGLTPLHLAIRNNNNRLVKLLLMKYNASAKVANSRDNNALHLAIQQQNKELVKIVLESSNVDLTTPNLAGVTALDLAEALKGRKRKEILDLLHAFLPFPTDNLVATTAFIKEEPICEDCSSTGDDDDKSQLSLEIKEETEEIYLKQLLKDEEVGNRLGQLLNVDNKWKKVGSRLNFDHLLFMWVNFETFLNYVMGEDGIKAMNVLNAILAVDEEAANIIKSLMK